MTTMRRLGAGTVSLVGLMALLVGVPLALAAVVGWPLPHSWPSWTQVRTLFETSGIPDVVLIDTLAVVCWIAWLDFAVATIVEVVALVAGYPTPRLRVVRPWQPIAARMITSIVLATSMMGGRAQPSSSPHQSTLAVALAERRATAAAAPVAKASGSARAPRVEAASAPAMEYRVEHGDTLWGISAREKGNPGQWPAIWRRNEGRAEPDHRRFTDPNLIVPGWTLEVPSTPGASPTPSVSAPRPALPEPSTTSPSSASPVGRGDAALSPTAPSRSDSTPPSPLARTPAPPASTGPGLGQSTSQAPITGIRLPSGGMVGLGLAGSLAMALGAARLHERRRRRVGSVEASRVDRLVTPAIGRLTRAATAGAAAQSQDGEGPGSLAPQALLNTLRARACGPAEIPIGVSADGRDQVIVETVELSGVLLTGPGALRATRALLVTALADHRPWRAEVLVTDTVAALVGALPSLVNVRVISEAGTAISAIEDELLRRQRALALRGATDQRSTLASPDPMDTLLAFLDGATLATEDAGRVDTVVALGRRLGVSVVVVGDDAAGDGLHVDENGAISPPAERSLGGARQLFVLSAEEAGEMLGVVAAGQGEPIVDGDIPVGPEPHRDAADGIEETALESSAEPSQADPVVVGTGGIDAGAAMERAVQLRLFGPPRVEVLGAEVMTGLRGRGRELLCLLAVRPEGVRQEELIDILWPDEDTDWEKSRDLLTTAVTSTRRRLRDLTNDRGADHIVFSGDRYRLDPSTVDADVWRLDAALHAASRATSDPERLMAFEGVALAQPAEPLAGVLYPWAEAVRERLRRRAVDALCELAELRELSGQGARAVTALEAARIVDPCREEVYQRLIALQLRLGRDDAALRAFRELARELHELGEAPSPETAALLQSNRRPVAGGLAATPPGSDGGTQAVRLPIADDDGEEVEGELRGSSAVAARRVAVRPRTPPTTSPSVPRGGAAAPSHPRLPILDEDDDVDR